MQGEEDSMSDDNDGDYAQILKRMREVFSTEKKKPKEVMRAPSSHKPSGSTAKDCSALAA